MLGSSSALRALAPLFHPPLRSSSTPALALADMPSTSLCSRVRSWPCASSGCCAGSGCRRISIPTSRTLRMRTR
eukprot:3041711-Alexandrium_andersonii.AAC.1